MTNALISTVVAAGATFIAAGLVIQFAVGSSKAAQQELRGGVQIDQPEAMYQLVMYDALIAYQCDSTAGGNLDGTGNNDWAPWSAYKDAAKNLGGDFTFEHLNESFRGDELKCYGTDVSIGGTGVWNAISPSSREWRNDQEGEHSRIRWSVNKTSGPVELKQCLFVDQPAGMGWPGAHNPDNGWNGITDMVFYFTHNNVVNSHDYTVHRNNLVDSTPNCQKREIIVGGSSPSGNLAGNFLTVTVICDDFSSPDCTGGEYTRTHSSDNVQRPADDTAYANRIRGPDSWSKRGSQIPVKGYKLCPGARGYVQTNTGWTWGGSSDKPAYSKQDYMSAPPYVSDQLPGKGDQEKYNDENDDQDNSVHPVIVIEDVGDTSSC